MRLLRDILKEKSGKEVKYSQGRVYLFITIIAYLATLGFLAYKTIACDFNVNVEAPQAIIDALQWIIGILAGYVFGGKGIEALKLVMQHRTETKAKKEVEIEKKKIEAETKTKPPTEEPSDEELGLGANA
jgi:hypothetical protein